MFLVVAFLLLVSGASALQSLDLQTILYGVGSVAPKGSQRYWLHSKTFEIKINNDSDSNAEAILNNNHLWEINIHSDIAYFGASPCDYVVGFVEDGHRHPVKQGGFGNRGSFERAERSTAILFFTGNDIPVNATHVYVHVDSCYIGRYITRWEMDAWNGRAFLLDWTRNDDNTTKYYPVATTPQTNTTNLLPWLEDVGVTHAGGFPLGLDTLPLGRDSSIGRTGYDWWGRGIMWFDYTQFLANASDPNPTPFVTMEQPVLDIWGYLPEIHSVSGENNGTGGVVNNGFASLSLLWCSMEYSDCAEFIDYLNTTWAYGSDNGSNFTSEYPNITSYNFDDLNGGNLADHNIDAVVVSDLSVVSGGYFRLFYDLRRNYRLSSNFGNFSENQPEVGVTALYGTANAYSFVFPPYAKLWDFRGPCVGSLCSPFLLDFTGQQERDGEDCVRQDRSVETNDVGFEIYGYGFYLWDCAETVGEQVTIRSTTPSQITELVNPWMEWVEMAPKSTDNLDDQILGYRIYISTQSAALHVSEYESTETDGTVGHYQFQVSLNMYKVTEGLTISANNEASGLMSFSAVTPIYSGAINVCEGVTCSQHGLCHPEYFGFVCVCEKGWMGDDCSTIDPGSCDDHSCLNGATCTPLADGYECVCDALHEGFRCERAAQVHSCPVLDLLLASPECLNGGHCVPESGGKFTCNCLDGWTGKWCEIDAEGCNRDPFACGEHGTCASLTADTYRCECDAHWGGTWCDVHDVCAEASDPCMNGGRCEPEIMVNGTVVARCLCNSNYFGALCEDSYRDFSKDCRFVNGGNCNSGACMKVEDSNQWRCKCNVSWTGDFCDAHTDCSPNPCENGGICDHSKGVTQCTCAGGWFGEVCTERLDDYFQDCRYGAKTCVEGHGSCVEVLVENGIPTGRFQCHCNKEFHGEFCELSDACNPSTCQNSGECMVNSEGASTCYCQGEWTGDHCEMKLSDVAREHFNTWATDCRFADLSCQNGGICTANTGGSAHSCHCTATWTGDKCDVAHSCDPNPCHNNGICESKAGETTCRCPGDFAGKFCEHKHTDEFQYNCDFLPCKNNGICSDKQCICSAGWVGMFCEWPSACSSNPCNGGKCTFANDEVMCMCPGDKFGDRCQYDFSMGISDCRVRGCMHGGACGSFLDEYICQCPDGYSGDHCQVVPHCEPNPCENGGVCKEKTLGGVAQNDFVCQCVGYWRGKTCMSNLATDLAALEASLTLSINTAVEQQVGGAVDTTSFAALLEKGIARVNEIEQEIDDLKRTTERVTVEAHQSTHDMTTLVSEFATKEQVHELRILVEDLLSKNPPTSVN